VIQSELGRGGFGVVYLANDLQLHSRPVVIKTLLETKRGQDEWPQRKFGQEIEALARIDHPGVVGVLDAGQLPDGGSFVVLQYIDGLTLRSLLRNGPLAFEDVASIIKQIGNALTAAHTRGVWHRDLKPENIMLQDLGGGDQLVKIIDFGIASVRDARPGPAGSAGAIATESTRVSGSYPYMAPEQLIGKPTQASDIYAMGVIAWEMLTGRRPFHADNAVELYHRQQQGFEFRPEELCPGLPPSAAEVVRRALSFHASDRQGSAREFGEALAGALLAVAGGPTAGSNQLDPAPSLDAQSPSKAATGSMSGSAPAETPRGGFLAGKRGLRLPATALTVCLLLAAGLAAWYRMKPATSSGPHPAEGTAVPAGNSNPAVATALPLGYAVVVGVGKYPSLNARLQIPSAERDAQLVYGALINPDCGGFYGRNVHVLTNEKATLADLRGEINGWLPTVAKEDNRVLIYFAGHGFIDGRSGKGYLAPFDVDPNKLASTALPMEELAAAVGGKVRAKSIILITDASHSGAISPLDGQIPHAGSTRTGRSVLSLTASRDREDSCEGPSYDSHGVFTYYLVKGMEGAADTSPRDGKVTADELAEYVHVHVRDATDGRQNPTSDKGSFDPQMLISLVPRRD